MGMGSATGWRGSREQKRWIRKGQVTTTGLTPAEFDLKLKDARPPCSTSTTPNQADVQSKGNIKALNASPNPQKQVSYSVLVR